MSTATHSSLSLCTAERAVLLYSIATYVPQFVLHMANEEAMRERFWFEPGTQRFALFIPFFLLLVYCLQRLIPRISVRARGMRRVLGRIFDSPLNLVLGCLLVPLAVNFAITAGISFRQSGDILSQAPPLVQLMMFSKPYLYAWLLYQYLRVIRGEERHHTRTRVVAAMFGITLLLSLTGSLDALPICWMGLFVVKDAEGLRQIFLVAKRGRSFLIKALLIFIAAPLAAGLIVVIIAIGWINKQGIEGSEALLERIGIGQIASATMVRASSSYAAVVAFADHNLTNFNLYEQVLRIPIDNVPYRLSLFFGDPLPRPEITQVARLNYLNYESDTSLERAGASPGLVASAFYAGPFPLGFLLIGLYTVTIIRIVEAPFASAALRPRITTGVFVASFIFQFFETPIDYLVFVDPAFLQFMLILGAFMSAALPRSAGVPQGHPISFAT